MQDFCMFMLCESLLILGSFMHIILQFGLDFWILCPQPIRLGLDTENLRIKSDSMYDIHQQEVRICSEFRTHCKT